MNTISAKVIADSISPMKRRLTTLQLCCPRFIHSEFMTHRVFSRNAASSRAIPIAKMIEQVRTDPAMPIHWGANQAGMQASSEVPRTEKAQDVWRHAAQEAAATAELMADLGLHKQVVNRILEPFQWMHIIVSATEWDNFFDLRDHPDAQPEIRALAVAMQGAMAKSSPKFLGFGEWHLPYCEGYETRTLASRKISAARCARVSYLTHDGQAPEQAKDLALFERLAGSAPLHASPLEHQATPATSKDLWRNFQGWEQFRTRWEATNGNR